MFIIGEKCRATTFELKIAIFGCARKRHVKAAHINDAQEGSISAIHVYVHLLDYIYFLDHGEEKVQRFGCYDTVILNCYICKNPRTQGNTIFSESSKKAASKQYLLFFPTVPATETCKKTLKKKLGTFFLLF